MKKAFAVPAALCGLLLSLAPAFAEVGTAFTYQGRLTESGAPASGRYDFNFNLYSVSSGGAPAATGLTNPAVAVKNGLFTTTLDFGGVFDGTIYWLEIGARTNGSATDFTVLTPRQQLTPSPYASFAGSASLANSTAPGAVTTSSLADNAVTTPHIADGTVVRSLNGLSDWVSLSAGANVSITPSGNTLQISASGGGPSGWSLSGNGGTPNGSFVGTSDNLPLRLGVNNAPALRLVPTGDSPQVIGGASINLISAGTEGATIGGGGSIATYGSPYPNQIFAYHGTIEGGLGNTISNNAIESTIAGGNQNTIAPGANRSTIGGGILNSVIAAGGTIGGGQRNSAGPYGTVGGGHLNQANGDGATVGGGEQNTSGGSGTVGGGYSNAATSDDATVAGGALNTSSGYAATVAGGVENWSRNQAATVGGGQGNTNSGYGATVGGGYYNLLAGSYATVGGGYGNAVLFGSATTIAGGYQNLAGYPATSGGDYASVGGGKQNNAEGFYATVPGGLQNYAKGTMSFAAGYLAQALHDGSFVWADSTFADFASTANNQFCIRAHGGIQLEPHTSIFFGSQTRQMLNLWSTTYGIGIQNSTEYFRTDGGFAWYKGGLHNDNQYNSGGGATLMTLSAAGLNVNGTFVSVSDRNAKENFASVRPSEVLEKLATLPITSWNYKLDASTRHLGPMAQDFYAAFGVGPDDKHIAVVDEGGVALAAIQGLNLKVEEKEARIRALEKELSDIKRLLLNLNK